VFGFGDQPNFNEKRGCREVRGASYLEVSFALRARARSTSTPAKRRGRSSSPRGRQPAGVPGRDRLNFNENGPTNSREGPLTLKIVPATQTWATVNINTGQAARQVQQPQGRDPARIPAHDRPNFNENGPINSHEGPLTLKFAPATQAEPGRAEPESRDARPERQKAGQAASTGTAVGAESGGSTVSSGSAGSTMSK